MKSNGQLLAASKISIILKEILNKICCLNDASKQNGSTEFYEYLSSMAALIGDEIVINGLSIVESYGVSLHYDESNPGMMKKDPNEIEKSEVTHSMEDNVDPLALDQLLQDDNEDYANDVFEHLTEDKPNISVLNMNSSQISNPRKDSNDSTDLFSDTGNQSLEYKDETSIKLESTDDLPKEMSDYHSDALAFYEVIYSPYTQNTCYIMPDVNYCCCNRFQKNVVEDEIEYTCSHIVATWLAKALNNIRYIPEKPEALHIISRSFIEMVNEFH